jgi:hypothetical protein
MKISTECFKERLIAIILNFSSEKQRVTILKNDLSSSHHKDYIDHKKFKKL